MDPDDDQEWAETWSRRTDAEIASAWIDFQCRHHASAAEMGEDKAWWAVNAMMGLSGDDPLRALEICFLIARSSSDPPVLEALGAGPLEDLLSADSTFFDAIAHEATSSGGLVTALGSMWQSTIPNNVWLAVQRLIAKS